MTELPYGEVIPPTFDAASLNQRLVFVEFGERDVELLRDLEDMLRKRLDEITERFYKHLLAFKENCKVFKDESIIRHLAEAQKVYLMQMVQGPYDAAYFERRWRSGYIHNAIHVESHWFIGTFQLYHRIIYLMILKHYGNDAQVVVDHILALDKIMNMDMQL